MSPPPRRIRPLPRPGLPRRLRLVVLVLVVVFFLPALERLVVERWWFQSLGYDRVFFTRLFARLLLFAGVGTTAFVILYANVRIALRGIAAHPRVIELISPVPVALTWLMR